MDKEEVINDFIKWLSTHNLEICSFSKNISAYWPINSTERLAERFLEK